MKGRKMKRKLLITVLTISMLAMAACGKKKEVEVTPEPTEEVVSENEVEAEPTEITEETEAVEVSANTASGTLSDDLYSFQISIGGKVVSVPMTYDQFLEFGFTPSSDTALADLDQGIEPNSYTFSIYHKKGESEITAKFINFGENVVPAKECIVGEIGIDTFKPDEGLMAENITLPKGIQFGVSTLEDVKAAYGDPTDIYEGELYTKLSYNADTYNYVEISVDAETNVISKISVRNFIPLESETSQTHSDEVSDEIPEVVTKYVAPTKLSDNLSDYTVEFDGDLYKLPTPVSEFVKNGWKVQEASSDMAIVAKGHGKVSLMRNNQTVDLFVDNYADTKTGVQNCFINEIKANLGYMSVNMKISEGIYTGMPEADFLKIIKGITNVETDPDYEGEYEIKIDGNNLNTYGIVIDKEKKIVEGIYVKYGDDPEDSLLK